MCEKAHTNNADDLVRVSGLEMCIGGVSVHQTSDDEVVIPADTFMEPTPKPNA